MYVFLYVMCTKNILIKIAEIYKKNVKQILLFLVHFYKIELIV